jgi:ribonuclease HI
MRINLGVGIVAPKIRDVMTFIDPDDRELQYVFIVFEASLKPTDKHISLSDEYGEYVWREMSEIQLEEITQSTQRILGLSPSLYNYVHEDNITEMSDEKTTSDRQLTGFSDGGSRGNPGPAASGFVLIDTTENLVSEGGAYIGIATNNVAEYQALYLALKRALELKASILHMKLDSELVVNQMNGLYKVNDQNLMPLHNRIEELMNRFEKVTFSHVSREDNTLADGMVNKLLDAHIKAS